MTEAARVLEADLREFGDPDGAPQALRELEHRGDEINHAIVAQLAETFVPPFDHHHVLGGRCGEPIGGDWTPRAAG